MPGYTNIPGLQEKIEEVVEEAVGELSVAASDVAVTPAGNIAATNVQSALQELDSEKAAASHTHAQGDVTNLTSDLAAKAPLASPTFTGTPAAPTAAGGTNTTQIATTAFVKAAIHALVTGAPGALDTLDELAAALGDDANFAATVTNALALKATLASPTFTGNPLAPTPSGDDNDTSIATTAFVQGEINDRVRCWMLEILDPVVGRYTFARAPGFAGTIQSLVHITNQGTVTCDVEIDGTDVTSLASIGADNSETTTSASGANTFTSGQRIELNVTAVSGGPQRATFALLYKRTGTT